MKVRDELFEVIFVLLASVIILFDVVIIALIPRENQGLEFHFYWSPPTDLALEFQCVSGHGGKPKRGWRRRYEARAGASLVRLPEA